MKPYWQSDDGAIVVFHARWEDVVAAALVPVQEVALVHADPPYGVNERTDRASKGRGSKGKPSRDWPSIHGDSEPFDPALLLALSRPIVLWGANHYAPRVPESPSWLVWDKRGDSTPDDNADGELAWTNLGGALRVFRHVWRGLARESETMRNGIRHVLGPCQKPIALCTYVYGRAKLKRGDLVFVPFLGSGPDLPAARAMGLRLIGCDVERWCVDTAISRLHVITPETASVPVGPLFERVR